MPDNAQQTQPEELPQAEQQSEASPKQVFCSREADAPEEMRSYAAADAPDDCPFPKSRVITGLRFTGRFRNYTNADTWYPSWASDGNLYSPWTDGYIEDPYNPGTFDKDHPGYPCNSLFWLGRDAATAQARIQGSDPLDLTIDNFMPRVEGDPAPFQGRYPCGSLVYNGVWYYGTYCLTSNPKSRCDGVGWTELGPFVGFRVSKDFGKTWEESPRTPANPLFGECYWDQVEAKEIKNRVKIGAPHFVDFGKNMEHSPDGYAYMLAQGSSGSDPETTWNNWIQADHVYMVRVKPSEETMNDPSAWEYFRRDPQTGEPGWTTNFEEITPLLEWQGRMGCVTVTYNPKLSRFLMWVTRSTSTTVADTMLLEAESLTGPWSIAAWMPTFGPCAYFVNMPSKFIAANADGVQGTNNHAWLLLSANHGDKWHPGDPKGCSYTMALLEMEFVGV